MLGGEAFTLGDDNVTSKQQRIIRIMEAHGIKGGGL